MRSIPKEYIIVSLTNFLIAAIMGLTLRFSFVGPIGLNYRFLTHAHSHIAMLGWVYLMIYALMVHYFVPQKKPIYRRLFWMTEIAVIGMALSFPFQGYAIFSIIFSTLHIFCSYYFVYLIWKNHRIPLLTTRYLLKAALVFMLFSTVGVWCLGPAVGLLGQASAFYQIAIQFFLHFQFNGWFLMAVLAIFFYVLKIENSKLFQRFYKVLVVSTLLTFALPVQWFLPYSVLVYINVLGIIFQLIALYMFFKLIGDKLKIQLRIQPKLVGYIYHFSISCFVLKILLQTFTIVPKFSEVVFLNRNFVIGFIHLVMLGFITGFLFAFLMSNKKTNDWLLRFGIYSFLSGFILTEIILLIQGCRFYLGHGLITNYYLWLFIFSVLLPLGVLSILIHFLKSK
ncbi:hypothetical protein [Tenacibaculum sp. UWU-22]|uniref:hypothetical protein n=1 Tax=Tenacibaculum sp. UWU-22 TaxID=3234187 RepID=UPI0034DB32E9